MKANTHPTYYDKAQVVCVCGNRFTVGSTQQQIQVELCYKCHPFYTGEHRFADTRSQIKKFEDKRKMGQEHKLKQQVKKSEEKKKQEAPKSLREMLIGTK